MTAICVIQARRGSKRLPDKIMMPLSGKKVLEHVLERALKIPHIDKVVCAIAEGPDNQEVIDLTSATGCIPFEGSELDVLKRFYDAAKKFQATIVMRLTADCPLIDPFLCGEALDIVQRGEADYSGISGLWPHGLDCEVFTFDLLEKAHKFAALKEDREHVTLWMKGRNDIVRKVVEPPSQVQRHENRWVVDYPKDYEFLNEIAKVAPEGKLPLRWQDTLELIDNHPHLRDINANCSALWDEANKQIYKLASEHR